MQIKSLRLKSCRSWKIDETIISEDAKQKRDKILLYEKLRKNGCSEGVALEKQLQHLGLPFSDSKKAIGNMALRGC